MILRSTKGIDITAQGSSSNVDDININVAQSLNITANENINDAITITATQGGIDIEKVADETPEKIITKKIDYKKEGPSDDEIDFYKT